MNYFGKTISIYEDILVKNDNTSKDTAVRLFGKVEYNKLRKGIYIKFSSPAQG